MAALGKIRKRGVTLVIIIGLGLFAFIAEEAFRSCEATKNQQRQQVGEVLGNKVNVQEFQALVDEYQEVIKLTQGRDNLTEEELNQVKDQVWNQFVNDQLIANEAKKLGLTVTDEELQNILKEGTNPMLRQSPFVNQHQSGVAAYDGLKCDVVGVAEWIFGSSLVAPVLHCLVAACRHTVERVSVLQRVLVHLVYLVQS